MDDADKQAIAAQFAAIEFMIVEAEVRWVRTQNQGGERSFAVAHARNVLIEAQNHGLSRQAQAAVQRIWRAVIARFGTE